MANDFNEAPTPNAQEVLEAKTPKPIDSAIDRKQEHPTKPIPVIDTTVGQAKIIDIRGRLRAMSGDHHVAPEEDKADPGRQEGVPFFDVNDKRLLGKGGENLVYDIPDDPSKVGRVAIEPLIDQLAQAGGQQGAAARETLQAKLAAENATYDELCRYFGNEHVPQTTRSLYLVPTSREFLEAIHKTKGRVVPDAIQTPTNMLTIVAAQEKVSEINDDESLDVRGGLAEARDPKVMNTDTYKQAYLDATQALVCDPESASFDLDQFLVIHPALRETVEQAREDPQLAASLTDFVQKAMRYSKETGKSLDLNGAKNILFFKNPGMVWGYKLVDATSPYAEVALSRSRELMEKVVAKEPIEDHIDRHLLRSAVNYQRTLNGLSKQLGIGDHLDMIPHASTVTPSEFWDILYDGGPPQKKEAPLQQAA